MSSTFKIVFTGKILPGFTLESVRTTAAARLRLNSQTEASLFSGRRVSLKQGLSLDAAELLCKQYATLGMEVRAEPMVAAPAPAPTPSAATPLPTLAAPSLAEPTPAAPVAPQIAAAPAVAAPRSAPAAPLGLALEPIAAPAAPVGLALEPVAPPKQEDAPVVTDAEERVCPKCGERQPKRTLCRACGLDMPRFLAAQAQAEAQDKADSAQQAEAGSVQTPRSPRARQTGRGDPSVAYRLAGSDSGDSAPLFGLGFSGRVGRIGYLTVSSLTAALVSLAMLLTLSNPGAVTIALSVLMGFVAMFFAIRITVLRLHDIGKSGLLVLLLFIGIGLILSLAIYFWPGDDGSNNYGEEPDVSSIPLAVVAVVTALILHVMATSATERVMRDKLEQIQQMQERMEHEQPGGTQYQPDSPSNGS